jgi:hypothetical protein
MKRLFTTALLSLTCFVANAEWVLVSEIESELKIYADPATKRRTGNVVRMWSLFDFAKPAAWNGKAYYSSRIYKQYDCVEKTSQTLQSTRFAGKMLLGELVDSDNIPRDKSFVAPDTAGEHMLNFACK